MRAPVISEGLDAWRTPAAPVTTFSTASRARRRRAEPLGRASLGRTCSGIAGMDHASMAEADRQTQSGADQGSYTAAGRQPCPLPLRWTAPGAGGCRACVPPHPPAAGQLAATRPSTTRHGLERSGVGPAPVGLKRQKYQGRCPRTPGPPSRMSDQAVRWSSPRPARQSPTPEPREPQGLAALGLRQTLAVPENPGAARRVPDRGDDLRKPRSVPHACHGNNRLAHTHDHSRIVRIGTDLAVRRFPQVARRLCKQGVASSSLASSTRPNAVVANLGQHHCSYVL